MNEQIKRLAEEAGFVLWDNEKWNPGEIIDWSSNYDREIVKYTELIIKSVFDNIKDISEKQAIVTNEDLKSSIIKKYGLDND